METVADGPALRSLVLRMSQDQSAGGSVAARLKRSASGSGDTQSPAKEAATAATVAAVSTPTPAAAAPSGKPEGGEAPAAAPVIVDHPKEDDNSLEAAPLLNALSKSAHRLARKDSKKSKGDDGSASFSSHGEEDEEIDDDDESADHGPKRRKSAGGKAKKKTEKRARASTGSTSPGGSKKPKSGKKGTFTQEEDALIIELVKKHGAKWSLIKPFISNGRWTGAQIAQRYRRVLSPREKNIHPRIWSPMEELRLLSNWSSVEMRRWSDAAKHVGTGRCDVSCQYWAGKVAACQRAPWTKEEDEALVTAAMSHSLHVQPIAVETAHFEPGKQSRWEAFYTRVCLSLRHTRNSRTPYSLLIRWQELVPYIKNGKLEGVPEGQLPPPIPGATIPLANLVPSSNASQSPVATPSALGGAVPSTPLLGAIMSGGPIPPPPQTAQSIPLTIPGTALPKNPPDGAANALNDLRTSLTGAAIEPELGL